MHNFPVDLDTINVLIMIINNFNNNNFNEDDSETYIHVIFLAWHST